MVHTTLTWQDCGKYKGAVAILTLNRPDTANAFNAQMIEEISAHVATLAASPHCRVLVLRSKGKNFCAGADLEWMKQGGSATLAENVASSQKMAQMFYGLFSLPMPTVAVVQGAAFGGGVGLVSCCDFAVASENAKFCLSEVKVGLLPAVILPYLQLKIPAAILSRFALGARVFSAAEAKEAGLIALSVPQEEVREAVEAEVAQLLLGSGAAQRRLKKLRQESLEFLANSQPYCLAISEARASEDGQAGLNAFLERKNPPWQLVLDKGWFEFDG